MATRLKLCGLLLLLFAAIPAQMALAETATQPRLTPEMVVDLERVTAVAISPDGRAVAYTVEVARKEDDEPGDSYSELWVASLEDGKTRHYAGHSEEINSPAWSPDGELITFRLKREKVHKEVQIYAIPARGGEARLLTRQSADVQSYRWSPDGKWIAFAAKDHDTEARTKEKEGGQDWVVWGEEPKHRHLWLLSVNTGESQRLFSADLDAREIHWTPDGESVVFQATTTALIDDEYMFTQIYRAPALGDEDPEVVTPTEGKLGHMAISPDGKTLAYLGATSLNDPVAQSLFVVPLNGGFARNLTQNYAGSAANLAWKDNQTIALLSAEGESHALLDVNIRSGKREPANLDGLVVRQFDCSTATGALAVAAESPAHPAELFFRESGKGSLQRLSRHSRILEDIRLASQEVIQWKGAEDWDIHGVLTYPLDYEKGQRYPLVLQVHGGPEGVSLNGWTTTPGYPVQLLAARGYAVLQPNYRGSSGRGVAFSKADHDDLGGTEFEDILAGVDALVERGLADPDRVGTGGWSYGGYMSAWAATRHSERFRASVVAAGLTNWIAFAGSTDIPYEMSIVHWNSWWFDEPELHWRRSPLAHINKARTPTLIVTGAEDERVHPEQAMELHTGLRIKDVPTQMVFYPREPHGLDERAHRLDFIGRTLDWFDKYLSAPKVEAMEDRRD
ncbi:MAG: S9 family peptidase [bacterium]|nr:S9 family peptidase [bacterium]